MYNNVKYLCVSIPRVAYRTLQHALTEKQHKLKKLLHIPDDDKRTAHAQDIQDRITDYVRMTGARLNVDNIKRVRLDIQFLR